MEYDGLKINLGGKKEQQKISREVDASSVNDFVADSGLGKEILEDLKQVKIDNGEKVIYGVYDNSKNGFWQKANDFLIDHSKVSLKDKSYFFHMLAVMVDAGMPVIAAVSILAKRSDNERFRRILNTVAYSCERGSNLADSMSRFEDVFEETEIGIIKSGEATGRLNQMLFKLSAKLDKRHDLSLKLWGAAVYPLVVLSVLILVTLGMMIWIFPNLLGLLESGGITNDKLPFFTRILIGVQGAFVNYWWVMVLVVLGIYGFFNVYFNTAYGAVKYDYFKLKLPFVGKLLRKIYVLDFVSLLGILIESGLPVVSALKITGNSIPNRIYKIKIQEVIDDVKYGEKISESMADSLFLFPHEVVEMFGIGERSASLSKISEKIAGQYSREIDNTLKKLSSIFEPVMILVVGLFVALLALAIMAPIFNLSNSIG